MGEREGGEGRDRQVSTADFVRSLYAEMEDPIEPIERILVRAASETLYAVQVWRRGDPDPDSFLAVVPGVEEVTGPEPGNRNQTEG